MTSKYLSGIKEASQKLHNVAYCIDFTDGLNGESMKFKWLGPMRNNWQSWEQKLSPQLLHGIDKTNHFKIKTLNLAYKIITLKKILR